MHERKPHRAIDPMTRRRHRIHGNPFNVRGEIERPDWQAVFGRHAPMALDVGFGGGCFTFGLAQRHPEWNVLGLEIRNHLVDDLVAQARAAGLKNLHAMVANASLHLDSLIPDDSLAFVAVNFPDPWYKKRHHKRRVVRSNWIEGLRSKLLPGAELHAMTDYEPVGHQILALLSDATGLVNVHGSGAFAGHSTTGIASERELTHVRRGEHVWRLQFRFDPT
jgi:tRNA (guanine-N7-)-methyltransferase